MSAGRDTSRNPVNAGAVDILEMILTFSCQDRFDSFYNRINRRRADDRIHLRDFRLNFIFVTLCQTAANDQRL
mgnify:FL=1